MLTVNLTQKVAEWAYDGPFEIGAQVFEDCAKVGLSRADAAISSVQTPR